jgi:hypothetical protein
MQPETWYRNGGTGYLTIFGKNLAVSTTPENQAKVAALLNSLRNHDRSLVPTTMESLP